MIKYLEDKNFDELEKISEKELREFLVSLQEEMKTVSVHGYYRTLNAFFGLLYAENYLTYNPMKNVKPPKVASKAARTFTTEEIRKLLNCFDKTDFFGLRNYIIMIALFSTGIRKTELLQIKLQDINVTTDLIRIDGKGRKERLVPIGRTFRRSLLQYLRQREEYLEDERCEYLFINRYKRRLRDSGLNEVFYKLRDELQITGERVSSHTWRHTFAKTFLLNGGDVFSLQKIMGHTDIATTRIYLNLNDTEMKQQHAKFNPLDNKDWLY